MIRAKDFINKLELHGISYFSGVPCSYLKSIINEVIRNNKTHYIPASSEGDALAIISGTWFKNKVGVVLCQNSGLGNMVNPISSLNIPYQIPVLLLISWRGQPGLKDEPQHKLMGEITPELLTLLGIKWSILPKQTSKLDEVVQQALHEIEKTQLPFALIVEKNTFMSDDSVTKVDAILPQSPNKIPMRIDALEAIITHAPKEAIFIATTGYTGRELFTIADNQRNLYCVGAMGYANAIGHGISLTSNKPVYIIDGDGAAIMHLGNLASIGSSRPHNLVHILLDNGVFESTGKQDSLSKTVNFAEIAKHLGYQHVVSVSTLEGLINILKNVSHDKATFIHVNISAKSLDNLMRPTMGPNDIARRLSKYIHT